LHSKFIRLFADLIILGYVASPIDFFLKMGLHQELPVYNAGYDLLAEIFGLRKNSAGSIDKLCSFYRSNKRIQRLLNISLHKNDDLSLLSSFLSHSVFTNFRD